VRWSRARYAALLLGVGLGGFLDGIVLHQILQWHQMLSAVVAPHSMEAMQRNMTADGLFHAATWIVTFAGVLLLWSAAAKTGRMPSWRELSGWLFLGWGWFNLIEGVVDHHLLELHHVRDLPAHVPFYDWLFLAVGGVGFIALGFYLRAPRARSSAPGASGRAPGGPGARAGP
jgi:uncharacterized membrane protein